MMCALKIALGQKCYRLQGNLHLIVKFSHCIQLNCSVMIALVRISVGVGMRLTNRSAEIILFVTIARAFPEVLSHSMGYRMRSKISKLGGYVKTPVTKGNLLRLYFISECTLLFGPDTYILSIPPGWLGGMLILMTKVPNKSPYGGFYKCFGHYAATKTYREN